MPVQVVGSIVLVVTCSAAYLLTLPWNERLVTTQSPVIGSDARPWQSSHPFQATRVRLCRSRDFHGSTGTALGVISCRRSKSERHLNRDVSYGVPAKGSLPGPGLDRMQLQLGGDNAHCSRRTCLLLQGDDARSYVLKAYSVTVCPSAPRRKNSFSCMANSNVTLYRPHTLTVCVRHAANSGS